MFKRIIVPLDGSRLAEKVLPAAVSLAETLGMDIMLLHLVEEHAPESVHGEAHLTSPEQAFRYLEAIARTIPPGVRVESHVHEVQVSSVADSISRHAGELSSDLIAMCTHGHGGLTGWLVGSIAQQVIGLGSVPVLLISPYTDRQEFSFREILIPLDGNPEHEEGLHTAASMVNHRQARLHLVQVIPTLGTLRGAEAAAGRFMPGSTLRLLDMAEQEALEHLTEHSRDLETAGFDVTVWVRRGDPVEQIIAIADHLPADLIVLGTHGKAGHKAFWEGSVAPIIAGRTVTPLLLVPVHGRTQSP